MGRLHAWLSPAFPNSTFLKPYSGMMAFSAMRDKTRRLGFKRKVRPDSEGSALRAVFTFSSAYWSWL